MDATFGWMFVGLAALFSLGVVPRWAGRFYPTKPGLRVRLAAPVIFGLLAAACFVGAGFLALGTVVVLGGVQVLVNRRAQRRCRAAVSGS